MSSAVVSATGAWRLIDRDGRVIAKGDSGERLSMAATGGLLRFDARDAVAEKGARSMDVLAGALERTVSALDPYLMQFRLEGRPNDA